MPEPKPSFESLPPVATVRRTAEVLCVSVRMVQRLIEDDQLKVVRIGRCVRVTTASIGEFLAKGGTTP